MNFRDTQLVSENWYLNITPSRKFACKISITQTFNLSFMTSNFNVNQNYGLYVWKEIF